MPRSTRSATPAATSERIPAATAFPSSILATDNALEGREELGSDLLLAAHHTREVYDAVLGGDVEGPLYNLALSGAQEIRALPGAVRDHQRVEEVALPLSVPLQGLDQLVFAFKEVDPNG